MHKNIFKNKYKHQKDITTQSGMTLVELIVVLALFMIVASLTIFDYGKFRSNVSLQNLGDDIALSIRRTQNYAIGVHSSQSSVFADGYGIHFSTATPDLNNVRAGSNKTFIIFNDLNKSKVYDYTSTPTTCNGDTLTSSDECIEMLNITSNDYIYQVCSTSGGVPTCTSTGSVDISFFRPDSDAYIYFCNGSCSLGSTSASIVVKNLESGNTKTISISNVGQISIQ